MKWRERALWLVLVGAALGDAWQGSEHRDAMRRERDEARAERDAPRVRQCPQCGALRYDGEARDERTVAEIVSDARR